MIDTHSHILPGIDDGARSLDESVEIVRELVRQGVTDVVATPHFVNETNFVSPYSKNKKLLMGLKKRLAREGVKVNVYLGNEVYIDDEIVGLLDSGKITTYAGGKYLLVELPLNDKYPNYEDILRDLMEHGYKVVLAHPERYAIVQEQYGVVEELCRMGVFLQCNLGSINGKYGREAKKIVKKLVKDGLVFAFGSDIHRCSGGDALGVAQKKLTKYYSESELNKVLVTNPKKILKDDSGKRL